MISRGWYEFLVVVAGAAGALACSGPLDGEGEPRGDEPVTQTAEPVLEAMSMQPVATALEVVDELGISRLWVFACDTNHQLKRKVRALPGGSFGSWVTLDSECQDGLSIGNWANTDTKQVFLYLRDIHDQLWQVWFARSGSNTFGPPAWTNVSEVSGIGPITGAPRVINAWSKSSGEASITVAATADSRNLYVLRHDGVTWTYQPVYRAATGTSTIATRNPFRTVSHAWGEEYGSFLFGRGFTASDDATAWRATSGQGRWYAVDSWTGSNGIPGRYFDYSVARFGTTLKRRKPGETTWQELISCSVAGDPLSYAYDNGASGGLVTGSSGDLQFWIGPGGQNAWCGTPSLGGFVASEPVMFNYRYGEFNALYRGTNGHLWMYDDQARQHTDLGLTPLMSD